MLRTRLDGHHLFGHNEKDYQFEPANVIMSNE